MNKIKALYNLNKTIRIARNTKLYSEKGGLRYVHNINQICKLPFTTKSDLRNAYPFSGLAVPISRVIEVHTTSGTTGKPTLSFFTKKDLDEGSSAISSAWRCFGINKNSRVMFIMSYGLYSGAMLNTYAIQSLGALVVPAGIQPTEKQVNLLIDFKIDTVVATPGFLLYLYEWLDKNKVDRNRLRLKRGIAAAEIYSNDTRNEIEEKLKIKVYDHYGLCEVNTGIAYECDCRNGLHVLDDYVIPEIIDVKSGKPLPPGKYGELVLTSLKKEASPIIRYKTGDITRIMKGECSCGRKSVRIDRIKLRVDDTIYIKGLKIDPHELKSFIKNKLGNKLFGGDIQFIIKKHDIKFVPKVILSLKDSCDKLLNELSDAVLSETRIRFEIENKPNEYFDREKNNKLKLVLYV